MGRLVLENISRIFDTRSAVITALDRFSLEIAEGRLLVLLGPSGCGKTTLLRLIAGLDQPSSGHLSLDGQPLDGVPPQKRPIGMAFQYPTLLPQLTVRENIALGPKLRGVPAADARTRVAELSELLGLTGLLDRAPETLSGGQQQRVSLARALANRPSILLLDEPLANLDPLSRSELREVIRSVQQQLHLTTIYVTHDQSDAAAISDQIALLNRGALQQLGSATDIYRDPANLFVAEFFDHDRPNIFPAILREGRLHPEASNSSNCSNRSFPIAVQGNRAVTCVVRTRSFSPTGSLQGSIQRIQHTGWSTKVVFDFGGLCLRAEIPFSPDSNVGDPFSFGVDPRDFLLFDPASGTRIQS
jgi:ABC-type sugar transport system ATPase subunit